MSEDAGSAAPRGESQGSIEELFKKSLHEAFMRQRIPEEPQKPGKTIHDSVVSGRAVAAAAAGGVTEAVVGAGNAYGHGESAKPVDPAVGSQVSDKDDDLEKIRNQMQEISNRLREIARLGEVEQARLKDNLELLKKKEKDFLR